MTEKEKASPDYDERMYEVDHLDLTRPGKSPKRIFTTEAGTYAMFLSWSPDGTRAYFIEQICWSASMNADGMPAYEVDLKSGRTRPLLNSQADDGTVIMPFPSGSPTRQILGSLPWFGAGAAGKPLITEFRLSPAVRGGLDGLPPEASPQSTPSGSPTAVECCSLLNRMPKR